MTLDEAIERLYSLNPGTTPVEEGSPHERPHKPLLILAALDLIDEGLASPDRIPWCRELRDRFSARFLLVRKHNDQNTPENPFYFLQTQGFWQAWIEEDNRRLPLQTTPLVSQLGKVFARFTGGFEHLAAIPATRQLFREALISRYFPNLFQIKNQQNDRRLVGRLDRHGRAVPEGREAVGAATSQSSIVTHQSDSLVADEPVEYGRSPAFRRLILDIYDHQCAACGLRIRLASGNDVSFIDAAHLIPFAESRNDHPTNGLALCKNHHWAMDRDIIAPGPDLHWHVSKLIDPRTRRGIAGGEAGRSNGERELADLSGKSLLLPKDPAFHPDEEGLRWRCKRLSA